MVAAKTDRPGSTVSLMDSQGNHLDFTRLPLRASPGDEAGIYAFAGRNADVNRGGPFGWLRQLLSSGRERPVFFGEADSLMLRLERHELLDEARTLGATALWVHFTPRTQEADRTRMVQSLIKAYQPPLNKLRNAVPRAGGGSAAGDAAPPQTAVEPTGTGPYRRRDRLLQGLASGTEPAALPPPDRVT